MEQTSGDEQFGKATCKDNSERLHSCEFSPSCCLPCAAKGLRAAGLTDEIGIQRPGKSIRGGQARGHLPTAVPSLHTGRRATPYIRLRVKYTESPDRRVYFTPSVANEVEFA